MGLKAIKFEYEFNAIDCANCGMPFGVTPDFEDRRRKDHKPFYCPHGHSNVYSHETEEEKLRKRLRWSSVKLQWSVPSDRNLNVN